MMEGGLTLLKTISVWSYSVTVVRVTLADSESMHVLTVRQAFPWLFS